MAVEALPLAGERRADSADFSVRSAGGNSEFVLIVRGEADLATAPRAASCRSAWRRRSRAPEPC